MKLGLYQSAVCSTFTHACEAWTLPDSVRRTINGFNSRCLHVLTGASYRDTATNPPFDLVLAIRRRRMRYLGHILRMKRDRLLRRALEAYLCGGDAGPPEGSLLDDCQDKSLERLTCIANNRGRWDKMVRKLR